MTISYIRAVVKQKRRKNCAANTAKEGEHKVSPYKPRRLLVAGQKLGFGGAKRIKQEGMNGKATASYFFGNTSTLLSLKPSKFVWEVSLSAPTIFHGRIFVGPLGQNAIVAVDQLRGNRPGKFLLRFDNQARFKIQYVQEMAQEYSLDLLWDLLAQDSPAGDEGPLADWLENWLAREAPDAAVERLGDSLVVTRGDAPQVAVFAHLDTTGWTLGYGKQLLRIGGPDGTPGDAVRPVRRPDTGCTLARRKDGAWKVGGKTDAAPGSRFVYAAVPGLKDGQITAPYLDNRAGIWAALHALKACPNVALALSVQEETGCHGAGVTARRLYEKHGITQALIADLTWDTKHIKRGLGPAVSLRDSRVPRQSYLNRVLALAENSGLPFQREIESSGGSDGAGIDRSGVPMDWVFIGAPEKAPHTSRERVHVGDLQGMAALLVYLVNGLTENRS